MSMPPASPRVTVLLPVHNGAATVEAAVKSVLAQSFGDFELLVLDDASTDNTRELVSALADGDQRLVLRAEPKRGLVGTLNHGITLALGTYIARMDADDICLPDRFARQIEYLDGNSDCVAVGTLILKVDGNNRPRGKQRSAGGRQPRADALSFPPQVPAIAHPTAMMRTDVLRRIGGYRRVFSRGGDDRDLWWRLSEQGTIHELPAILLRYRVHADSVSRVGRHLIALSSLRADLSAIARHFGIDDAQALAQTEHTERGADVVAAYSAVLGNRYPVEAYCLNHLLHERLWPIAGFTTRRQMLAKVLAFVARRPFEKGSARLLLTTLTHGVREPRKITYVTKA